MQDFSAPVSRSVLVCHPCRALNIPTSVLASLSKQRGSSGLEALLIHLSTDQVYDGSRSLWTESDTTEPVNAYGQSKVAAETTIREQWPRHIILRSSIIYGPQSPMPVSRPLFVQFVVRCKHPQAPTNTHQHQPLMPAILSGSIV